MAPANHEPNELFRTARIRRGLSRQQLADAVNKTLPPKYLMTAGDIGRIERGNVDWPRAPRRAALRAVLRVSSDNELGLINKRRRPTDALPAVPGRWLESQSTPTFPPEGYAPASDEVDLAARVGRIVENAATMAIGDNSYQRVVQDLIDWATDMNRRDVLQWLSWAAGSAAAAPVLNQLDGDERDRTARALATPRRVDRVVIDHIDAVLWRCMRQDDMLGPHAALDTVLAQRMLVHTLLPDAAGPLKTRLLSLFANLSRFAGWLAFDLGNYPAASTYYETARSAAHEAEDTQLGAFVLCNMSHLATWRGQARVGIDHALAAQGWASQTDDLQLQAYAFDVAARAFAKAGRGDAASRALDCGEAALDAAKKTSSWVYFFNPGQLRSTRSTCHLYLGEADRAVETAEASLKEINGSFVRNLALTSVRLGVARLRMKKPDVAGGASAIADAARLASHNRSPRLAESLRSGIKELGPWQTEPAVKEALEQVGHYSFA